MLLLGILAINSLRGTKLIFPNAGHQLFQSFLPGVIDPCSIRILLVPLLNGIVKFWA